MDLMIDQEGIFIQNISHDLIGFVALFSPISTSIGHRFVFKLSSLLSSKTLGSYFQTFQP